jgi:hypothetical protein
MTRKIAGICLVVVSMLVASTLHAQSKPKKDKPKETEKMEAPPEVEKLEATTISEVLSFDTTSAPNDELTAAIKELMKITGAMKLGKQMAGNISEIQKNGPANQLPAEFYDRLLKEFESEQTNKWIINGVVRIYRQKFTLEEVKTITAFYQTPTGKKAVALLPIITQECMKQGEQIGRYLGMKVYYDLVREGKMK